MSVDRWWNENTIEVAQISFIGTIAPRRYACSHDDRVGLVIDRADRFIEHLSARDVEHEVIDLRLDEIFEAFVIGRTRGWPDDSLSPTAASA